MANAFTVCALRKTHGEGSAAMHARHGVNLAIPDGEIVLLPGPSGSGKSTLLDILGGLDRPTAGELLFRDRALSDMTDAQLPRSRRDHVGFVFQFYNLMPGLTARENVELVTEIARTPLPPKRRWRWSGSMRAPIISPRSFPVASSRASPSPGPWPGSPTCCSATNRPGRSTA